ncbi:MAG: oxidoreductase [Sinimarinibacterium sp.]|jgi:NAD(P)-dependent dehydrogenase (short-subunit alcohol dehydrogenase family)
MGAKWTTADMPSLAGKTALVTGANRGLGLEIAQGLSAAGAAVVIACRDPARAQQALDALRLKVPGAAIHAMTLDLADLASVRNFAQDFGKQHQRLDILIHNAAAILAPQQRTRDGFELHLGVNHLGPFALTGLLLEVLRAAPQARVLTTGSLAHRMTPGLNLDDADFALTPYKDMDAYAKSKLAALAFCFELDRRLKKAGLAILSAAAHPGYTATNTDLGGFFMRLSTRLFAQRPQLGALPMLYAASAPDIRGGDYIGPDGYKELGGHPRRVESRPEARDPELGAKLWAFSEQRTGVRYLSY